MSASRRRPPAWVVAASLAILGTTFVLDLVLPQGVAVSIAYVAAVLLGLWAPRSPHALVMAALATVLVTTGILLESGIPEQVTALNQLFALLGIWSAALVTWWHGQVAAGAASSRRELSAYKHALDQAAIVAITDARGRIRHANDRFCEISGWSRDELMGQDHRILNSGLHPKEFFSSLWSTIRKGEVWRGEIRNRARDGTFYWVDTVIVPFLDDQGRPVEFVAIRTDITERKATEAALFEQQALARLGEMAAVVAHEVKNPLAGIAGGLQIIGSRMPESSAEKPIIGEMLARIDALDGMVQDLLQFARPRGPRLIPLDLATTIEQTARLLASDPAFARTRLEVAPPESSDPVMADQDMVRQILVNLLLNAAHATQGEGLVRVETSESESLIRITVSDDGPGVPPDMRERIFEPFITTKSRGTGLGLPLARRHAEAQGGRLEIEPSARGARFVLSLPRRRFPDGLAAETSAFPAKHSAGRTT